MALEGGEGSASRPGRSLPLGKTRYPLYRRLGGPQGRYGQVRKISPPPGIDPRTVQPVASRHTDWATRPTRYKVMYCKVTCLACNVPLTLTSLLQQISHFRRPCHEVRLIVLWKNKTVSIHQDFSNIAHLYEGVLISPYPDQEGNKLYY